jgi:hypothetical protein
MATFKGLVKSCEVCSSPFKVPQSQAHVRTCSTACGYRIRKVANKKDKIELKCAHCGDSFFTFPSHEARRKYCSTKCVFESAAHRQLRSVNASAERNPRWKGGASIKAVSEAGNSYWRQQPHLETEKVVRRKRAKDKATPAWADIELMQDLYALARALTEGSGIQFHVDHQVPLTSPLVCGLHNEFNLRPIPAGDNLTKHNRTWPQMW